MANSFVTIQDYSQCLEDLLTKVIKNIQVVYSPVTLIWEQYQKQKDGKIKLPFISFFPGTEYQLDLENVSKPEYDLGRVRRPIDHTHSQKDQTLKVNISYYFEIVAQKRLEAEQILTELLFWFQSNQQITINRNGEEYDFTFLVDPTITDNSNYDNYHEEGMIYRFTVPINVEFHLFRSRMYNTVVKTIIDIKEVNDG